MGNYEVVVFEVENGVAKVTLNRPDALNALNMQLKSELADAWREIDERDDIRSVLLTGAGRAFSAGGDIMQMDADRGPEVTRQRMVILAEGVLIPLAHLDKPVVVAVNGHAHGLGLSLALAGDILYAAESAQVSFAFTRVGLAPDGCSSYFITRAVGLHQAKELMFTAKRMRATEAHELGFFNRVLPDEELLPAANELAASLASGPTIALGVTKRLLNRSINHSIEEIAHMEAYGQAVTMTTEDHREGIAAFQEKRDAAFTGS